LRRWRARRLGFGAGEHGGDLGETLGRRRGFVGRPRGVLASGPEEKLAGDIERELGAGEEEEEKREALTRGPELAARGRRDSG
jgi:hypothetical protein